MGPKGETKDASYWRERYYTLAFDGAKVNDISILKQIITRVAKKDAISVWHIADDLKMVCSTTYQGFNRLLNLEFIVKTDAQENHAPEKGWKRQKYDLHPEYIKTQRYDNLKKMLV